MSYVRKTRDEWRLYVKYGTRYGWEHETTEESYKAVRAQRQRYRENCPEYPTRIRCVRVRIEAEVIA